MRPAPARGLVLLAAAAVLALGVMAPSAALPGPTIDSSSPIVGPSGTAVTITGSGFTGTTEVRFNGTATGFHVDSDTRISTSAPAGGATGPISVTTLLGTATSEDPFTETPSNPNIVLILTDDQRFDELSHMPTVHSALVDRGVSFTNGFVVNPLCCPSRTTILTGKYSHGTDVYWNHSPHGGFETFRPEDGTTIATLLHDHGYRTALIGKYLNGYVEADSTYIPPGWDSWVAAVGDEGIYFDYELSVDGKLKHYGSRQRYYSTDVLARRARNFILAVPPQQPLFLYFAPHAPHAPAIPPSRYANACQGIPPLRPRSYNEPDVLDKPNWVRQATRLTSKARASLDKRHRRSCQTLLAVDDAVRRIVNTLQQTNRLANSLILFASDNGLLYGEHRLAKKTCPYEECVRVPIIVRFDPLTLKHAVVNPSLALNLDFAPTFANAVGLTMPGAEGASLLSLLADARTPWRSDFLIEHWAPEWIGSVPPYCAVRNWRYIYVEYSTGEEELYDLKDDPYQLRNQAGNPDFKDFKESMHARMVQLCQPPPPHFTP